MTDDEKTTYPELAKVLANVSIYNSLYPFGDSGSPL
jgi:hypothetical protein